MSSARREVWETLSQLLQQAAEREETAVPIKNELRKLGKTQFKANTLAQAQTTQWETAVAELRTAQSQNQALIQQLQEQQQQSADQSLLLALLPMVDDLEQILDNGRIYLSKTNNKAFHNWFDGIRLLQDRFTAILERNGVEPIPSVGEWFDPYAHRAVGVASKLHDGMEATLPNHIITEDRKGYKTAVGVLRYADVIVYKPEE